MCVMHSYNLLTSIYVFMYSDVQAFCFYNALNMH